MTTDNVVLDGSSAFSMLGTNFDWSGPDYFTESAGSSLGTSTINVSASGGWYAAGFEVHNEAPHVVDFNMTDLVDGNDRYIGMMRLFSGDFTIDLDSTSIEHLITFRDSDADITLGKYSHSIRLRSGETNTSTLTFGDEGAGSVRIESGTNTITTGSGNVQYVSAGRYGEAGTNTVSTGSGYIANLELSGTSHDITVGAGDIREVKINDDGTSATIMATSSGEIDVLRSYVETSVTATARLGSVELGGRDDSVTLSGGALQVSLGDGDNTIDISAETARTVLAYGGADVLTLTGTGRVYSAHLGQGNNTFNISDNARAATLGAWDHDDTLNMSDGSIEALDLSSGNNTINISDGWINAARAAAGDDTLMMTGGRIKSLDFSNGRNVVDVSGGTIDSYNGGGGVDLINLTGGGRITMINAGEGNNRISTGSEYTSAIEVYNGDDWIKSSSGYVGSIYTDWGNDKVIIGGGGAGRVDTSDGVDIVQTTTAWVSNIETGDDQDFVTIGSGGTRSIGLGEGNDRVYAYDGNIGLIDGWLGNEKIYMGNVWIRRADLSDGDDYMKINKSTADGGAAISGGAGIDTLDFRSTTQGINVQLNEVGKWQNIGAANPFDYSGSVIGYFSISSTERVIGTAFDDVLSGSDPAGTFQGENRLLGLGGNDTLNGLGGNDDLRGGAGVDSIFGGEGNDRIEGNRDGDFINGGTGNDNLFGGGGGDFFIFENVAGMGFDRIKDWQDGSDQIDLSDFSFGNFGAVTALASDDGANMRIDLATGTIYVENFNLADFDASDVIL